MYITVSLKSVSKRRSSVKTKEFYLETAPETVEELIKETVRTCVKDYNQRDEKKDILSCLSGDAIEDMAATGKVAFGVHYADQNGNYEDALKNALQSYEDGIYRIFMDDIELGKLKDPVLIMEHSTLTFVRLTMLTGRMW